MTPSAFRAYWSPAFDDVTDSAIQAQLDLAADKFDVARWGTGARYTEGLACFVAHQLKWRDLAAKNALGGDGLLKTVGRLTVSKDSKLLNAQADNYFLTTMYGRRYMFLARQAGQGAVFAGVGKCLA